METRIVYFTSKVFGRSRFWRMYQSKKLVHRHVLIESRQYAKNSLPYVVCIKHATCVPHLLPSLAVSLFNIRRHSSTPLVTLFDPNWICSFAIVMQYKCVKRASSHSNQIRVSSGWLYALPNFKSKCTESTALDDLSSLTVVAGIP